MFDPSMMGGGPAGPGGPPPMGAPAGPPEASEGPGPSPTSPPSGDKNDMLRQAIDVLTAYKVEEKDDEDLAAVAKIVADIQKLLASQQKLADQAIGAGPGAKFMRKQQG